MTTSLFLLITGFGLGYIFACFMLTDFTMRLVDNIESKIENYFNEKKKKWKEPKIYSIKK